MLLTRTFAQRRMTMLGLAGALLLCTFFVLPEGRAFAASLLLLFRGQTIQPVATDYAHLQNAYKTLEELEKLGSLQGTIPSKLNTVSSVSAAQAMAGFAPAQPGTFPSGISHTPGVVRALAPTTVTLTLHKTTADAYFTSIGSSLTLPAAYDGQQLVVIFRAYQYWSTPGPRVASSLSARPASSSSARQATPQSPNCVTTSSPCLVCPRTPPQR
jgi:hypothetical protein